MFEQSLVESTHTTGTRKLAAVVASLSLQAAVVTAVAIIPVLYFHALPAASRARWLDAPLAAVSTALAPAAARRYRVIATPTAAAEALPAPPMFVENPSTHPAALPPPSGLPGYGMAPAVAPALDFPPPAAAPPLAAPPAALAPVAVGGAVEAARCLACAPPQYPPFARQARLQGTVELHAVIGPDGGIQQLAVAKGNAVLAAAALQAVRHWRYQPLLLDGRAVAVATNITVNFNLGNL